MSSSSTASAGGKVDLLRRDAGSRLPSWLSSEAVDKISSLRTKSEVGPFVSAGSAARTHFHVWEYEQSSDVVP